jgi:prenyltransferase beta subunit
LGAVDSFENYDESATFLLASQNPGSGYGESAGSVSNIAVTYEVMRAFNLLTSLSFIGGQEALLPSDKEAVIKFVASCNNNTDGGYGDPPQAPSSAANLTYFATYTLKYLSAL